MVRCVSYQIKFRNGTDVCCHQYQLHYLAGSQWTITLDVVKHYTFIATLLSFIMRWKTQYWSPMGELMCLTWQVSYSSWAEVLCAHQLPSSLII